MKNSHLNRIIDSILDTATSELETAGVDGTRAVIGALRKWLANWFQDLQSKAASNATKGLPATKSLEELNQEIATLEEHMELGRQEKENDVWWAMMKLGYTKEQIKEVIDLANHARSSAEE